MGVRRRLLSNNHRSPFLSAVAETGTKGRLRLRQIAGFRHRCDLHIYCSGYRFEDSVLPSSNAECRSLVLRCPSNILIFQSCVWNDLNREMS